MLSVALLKVPVADIDQAVPFFRDGLGLTPHFVAADYGWADFQIGDLTLALYVPGRGAGNRTPGGSVDFHLSATDLESIQARLLAYDPTVIVDLHENNDGSQSLEFVDPNGNEWKIMRAAEDT